MSAPNESERRLPADFERYVDRLIESEARGPLGQGDWRPDAAAGGLTISDLRKGLPAEGDADDEREALMQSIAAYEAELSTMANRFRDGLEAAGFQVPPTEVWVNHFRDMPIVARQSDWGVHFAQFFAERCQRVDSAVEPPPGSIPALKALGELVDQGEHLDPRVKARSWLARGHALYAAGDTAEASIAYDRAIAEDAHLEPAYIASGLVRFWGDDSRRLIEAGMKVLGETPDLRVALGWVLHAEGKTAEAERVWREVLQKTPGHRFASEALKAADEKRRRD